MNWKQNWKQSLPHLILAAALVYAAVLLAASLRRQKLERN